MPKKEPELREFAKVPSNSIKEVLHKDRKYDSFVDEHKRIFQFGRTIKIKLEEGKIKPFFRKTIIKSFNTSGFKVEDSDLFVDNIIVTKNKKGEIKQRVKIIKMEEKNGKCSLSFQAMTKDGEIRTTVTILRPLIFGQKKYAYVTFLQLFKRDELFFGLKDGVRQKYMRNVVTYRAAKLFESFEKEKILVKPLPSWAVKMLEAAKEQKYIGI